MTEGNPKLIVRVPVELREQILAAIERRNKRTRDEPWDVSGFVRTAIRDKLAHIERSRRKRPTRGTGTTATAKGEG